MIDDEKKTDPSALAALKEARYRVVPAELLEAKVRATATLVKEVAAALRAAGFKVDDGQEQGHPTATIGINTHTSLRVESHADGVLLRVVGISQPSLEPLKTPDLSFDVLTERYVGTKPDLRAKVRAGEERPLQSAVAATAEAITELVTKLISKAARQHP